MTRLVMGCDPHLDTITAAVVDGTGREHETLTVGNQADGWNQLAAVCDRLGVESVGIEGASGYGRCLAQHLTASGVGVREIPTRLTARQRRTDGAGKTDPGDARTIARATAAGQGHHWVDNPDLETLRVLTARRSHLVAAQTADINQLRALLVDLDPAVSAGLGRLRTRAGLTRLLTNIVPTLSVTNAHERAVIGIITEIIGGAITRAGLIADLKTQIEEVMPEPGRRMIETIPGCGTIVAAQILSEMAGTDQFATDSKMAAWAGTAPLDASSGRQQRHRLNPGGNRQANRALYTIILTQLAHNGEAATYVARRISEGKTKKEAIRAAKRHLTRRIWKLIHTPQLT